MVNGQHFIEPAGNMEAHRPLVDKLVGTDFTFGQPAAFGTGKFEFIAVVLRRMGGQNRPDGRERYFANTRQVIDYLLVFEAQLFRILNMLPFAAATGTKMFAKGLSPYGDHS